MNCFKLKTKIVIFFIFITLHDADGVQRKDVVEDLLNYRIAPRPKSEDQQRVEVKKSETVDQEQVKNKKGEKSLPLLLKTDEHCVEKLEILRRSKNKNLLDHYKDLFKELNEDEDIETYDIRVDAYTFKCIQDPYSIRRPSELDDDDEDQADLYTPTTQYNRLDIVNEDDDDIDPPHGRTPNASPEVSDTEDEAQSNNIQNNTPKTEDLELLFICDLLITIYNLFPVQNATEYCKVKENNPFRGKPNEVNSCIKEIHKANLKFSHGLDNYLYLQEKVDTDDIKVVPVEDEKQNRDKKVEIVAKNGLLSTLQLNYIEYIFNKMATNIEVNINLGNTADWCKCKDCEDDLRDAGFRGRIDGSENAETLNSLYDDKCDSMNTETKKNYCLYLEQRDDDDELDGTFYWCADTV